jgi:esterase/lipase
MSEPWHGINDPGFFWKPEPESGNKNQVAITDDPAKPKEKPGPIVSLSDAKFVPPDSGLKFNDKCAVQVSVKYKEKTSQSRVTFKLFCNYNDKKDIDLKSKVDANESNNIAQAQLPLFYPDDYTDGPVEYYFKAEHCRGEKIIPSDKLTIPKLGWVPFLIYSKEYSKVNAYNLALLANLAYDEKSNIKSYFDALKSHSNRSFNSKRILANPFLVDSPSKDCFKILDKEKDIFSISGTDTQGFIASNSKQIVISIRGTSSFQDWLIDLDIMHAKNPFGPGYVHQGFLEAFNSIKDIIDDYYKNNGKDKEIIITGHSLGGAVATLIAAYLRSQKNCQKVMLYTFGSPRVGNKDFAAQFSTGFSFPYFRIVNNNDIVTKIPLPDMDLKTETVSAPQGGQVEIPIVLFNSAADPYAHFGTFIHIRKMANDGSFLSKLNEQFFSAIVNVTPAMMAEKLTLEALLKAKGYADDHDMTKYYCSILRANMMKSIKSYLGANDEEITNLEKDINSIGNEISDLENEKADIKSRHLDQSKQNYLISITDRMIEGRKKYLNDYRHRLDYYRQLASNKSGYLKDLICSGSNKEIETEFKFQNKLS